MVPDPYLLFLGAFDQPELRVDRGVLEIDIECSSAFDLLLEDDEGARLSDAFHQSIWPGELGMLNMTGIENDIYWGMATPGGSAGIQVGGVGRAIANGIGLSV